MKKLSALLSCCLIILISTSSSASTLGRDGKYYIALPMFEACVKYFPDYKEQIERDYNRFIAENVAKINVIKNDRRYTKDMIKVRMLVNYSFEHEKSSMHELKYKCTHFYNNIIAGR